MSNWFYVLVSCLLLLLFVGCDPIAFQVATPQIIIVTSIPSRTPIPTNTPTVISTVTSTATVAPTYTPTRLSCLDEKGTVVEIQENRSEIANENLRYRVYLPPCYQILLRRFPVVYLFHGSSYRETQWEDIGTVTSLEKAIQLDVLAPMILVMPYMGNIGNQNQFPPDRSYEQVILEELIPQIDRDFCTIQNRQYRAIGGISRGGFWALSIAIRHPDQFSAVGGHSAALDNTNIPATNDPLALAQNSALLDKSQLRIYIDNGAEDYAALGLQTFSNRLTQREIRHTYNIYPLGKHDEEYWRSHVGEYLEFYGRNWEKDPNALPSCYDSSF